MMATQTDTTRMLVEAARLSVRRTGLEIDELHRSLSFSRKAVEASRQLLKRLHEQQKDRQPGSCSEFIGQAAKAPSDISAFDCDILREVFKKLVLETKVPEDKWRDLATSLIVEFTDRKQIEPALINWIIRK
ncbi:MULTISPECIES: hypothetical protein [unclassified Mesorhizobium]|nr:MULTISPECIES: hypothetical protein [unclassified Mesorhizobium]MCA0008581.1 hypothetical protein [Mesorhizobium sp. B264B1B]TPI46808.1 hypothetical protein FJW11_28240 [Mesorhizobium sp. B3-1-1]TPJ46080.1 hypothetical protein FJ437_15530 [Mesorhizobium sp. B2-6-6]TPJ66282.1 hypothetical protein FJ462_17130 [Mesorhizobium sp. B2-6-7]TPJ94844.1 hypothetical protein FJ489_17645 [Mesorhizobium sp. B2-5-12]TPJ97857.1 hypothetical protein FJ491_18520 [Mesorhizobium sp. B2-5-10]TPK25378.1 hypoth